MASKNSHVMAAALGGVAVGAAVATLCSWGCGSRGASSSSGTAQPTGVAGAAAEREASFLGSQTDGEGLKLAESRSAYFNDVQDYKLILTKEEVREG
jgi:hypothetical protein